MYFAFQNFDPHPNRASRGLLRAKIECGEGTIPIKKNFGTLTWDGVLQGVQRLQFMSCSDKIALWNVIGIQGALLSHLIEPIYLETVLLGSLFNYKHLVRAIHGRWNLNCESKFLKLLPPSFKLNCCKVAKCLIDNDCVQTDLRQLTKAPNYSINWIKNDTKAEIIASDKGELYNNSECSRLCKRSLFSQFAHLLSQNISTLPDSGLKGIYYPEILYHEAKSAAFFYQKAKFLAYQTVSEQNLGEWSRIPQELDLFSL